MENLWNSFNLKKPPFITLPSTRSRFVPLLHAEIDEYFCKLSAHEEDFNHTAALLSRLMARRKNSFRRMYGFRHICKINAALCRLLRLDFKQDLNDFRHTLPDVAYEDGTEIHLLTRDCFDYLLLRLIAVHKLYERIEECCKQAAEYFLAQLKMNFFFEFNTLILSVVAKVHSMVILYSNTSTHLYNRIRRFREKLPKNVKSKFPTNSNEFQLPEKLDFLNTISTEVVKNKELNDLQQQHQLSIKTELPSVKAKRFKKTDIGCAVQRDVAKYEEQNTFNINNLNSVENVKKFISNENKQRSTNVKDCITKNIQSHEWLGATRLFDKKIRNHETKKALNIFCKFIQSKIN